MSTYLLPMSSNLHRNQRQMLRTRLYRALHLVDFGLAVALAALANMLWQQTTFFIGDAFLWVLCAMIATRINWRSTLSPTIPLEPYMKSVTYPLIAGGIFTLIRVVERMQVPVAPLLFLTIGWMAGMGLNRLHFRRRTPPLRIAVFPGVSTSWPAQNRVSFVPLKQIDDFSFTAVDALLIDATQPIAADWLELVLHARTSGIPIWTPTDLKEDLYGLVSVEYLHTRHTQREEFYAQYAPYKRLLDLGTVLVFGLPILLTSLVVAVIVLIDMGRPVLFWQRRIGQDGKPFQLVKFRTMRRDSEQAGAQFAQHGDQRVTPIGQILRKFRLDELPQFWNVLRGEMSVIGPRPEQENFVHRFNNEVHLYAVRHWVKPGITGWAQVTQGYAASTEETITKLRYDLYYIKHYSFWLDARIVSKTIWTILTGFGAR